MIVAERRDLLIWSDYHNAWHMRTSTGSAGGYTSEIDRAGLFDRKLALAYDNDGRNRAIPVVMVRDKIALAHAAAATRERDLAQMLAAATTAPPARIQLRRTKGWRLPPNTVKVTRGRGMKWGNPFTKEHAIASGFAIEESWAGFVVNCFRDWIGPSQSGRDWWQGPASDAARRVFMEDIGQLRGKNLACWCSLSAPCHADVLLELANRAPAQDGKERCHANRDGDCSAATCPQLRDGEPEATGRHCPIDTWHEDFPDV